MNRITKIITIALIASMTLGGCADTKNATLEIYETEPVTNEFNVSIPEDNIHTNRWDIDNPSVSDAVIEVAKDTVDAISSNIISETVKEDSEEVKEETVSENVEDKEPAIEESENPVEEQISETIEESVKQNDEASYEATVEEAYEEPVEETYEEPVQETVSTPSYDTNSDTASAIATRMQACEDWETGYLQIAYDVFAYGSHEVPASQKGLVNDLNGYFANEYRFDVTEENGHYYIVQADDYSTYQRVIDMFGAYTYDDDYTTVWETINRIQTGMTYDLDYQNTGFDDVLNARRGVCWAYAEICNILLNEEGIPSRTVASGDHAWNEAYFAGGWHTVDATWATIDDGEHDTPDYGGTSIEETQERYEEQAAEEARRAEEEARVAEETAQREAEKQAYVEEQVAAEEARKAEYNQEMTEEQKADYATQVDKDYKNAKFNELWPYIPQELWGESWVWDIEGMRWLVMRWDGGQSFYEFDINTGELVQTYITGGYTR